MTRTKGVHKAAREPVGRPRKPAVKNYGATAEYAMTAYERKRLERRTPTGTPLPGVVPGLTDCQADPHPGAAG